MLDSSIPVEQGEDSGPLILTPASARGCAFAGLLFFAIIWDGITIVLTVAFVFNKNGPWSIFPILFLIPFQLVGLALIAGVVYSFLALFNPRPTLVCSQQFVYPGEEFELSWMFAKSVSRITELKIFLEAMEQVTYQQGTSTRTESNVFYRSLVVQTTDPSEIAQGMRLMTLPENAMHTFTTSSNKIIWQVRFQGTISYWPDVLDTFVLNVMPPRLV